MNTNSDNGIIPQAIDMIFREQFKLAENLVFAQVATQSTDGPHLRTMRLYGIEEQGMVFLTHVHSRKWQDLQQDLKLALCFLHPSYQIQLLADCHAHLVSYQSESRLVEKYWNLIRSDVKKIYSETYPTNIAYNEEYHIEIPQLSAAKLGIILVQAYFWESMVLSNDYPNSERYHYFKNNQQWRAERKTVS